MRLLLDTHVLLALLAPKKIALAPHIEAMLDDADNEHHLSVASLWEIAIKARLGKLELSAKPALLPELIEGMGIALLPISARHALATLDPEPLTRDPFDNMLLAQCQVEGLRLLTINRALVAHPLAVRHKSPR